MKFKSILKILLILVFLITFFFILVNPITPDKIPANIFSQYNSMGVTKIDVITPAIVKIGVIAICITLLILAIINYKHLKKNLKPELSERWLVFTSFLFWYIFNDALNIMAGSPRGIYEIGIFFGHSGTPVLGFIYVGLIGSFFAMTMLFLRNWWNGKQKDKKHNLIGILTGLIGFGLMGISTYFEIHGLCGTCSLIFGLTRNAVYHIGVLIYIVSLVYYLHTGR